VKHYAVRPGEDWLGAAGRGAAGRGKTRNTTGDER
jgi:hypothetical protein